MIPAVSGHEKNAFPLLRQPVGFGCASGLLWLNLPVAITQVSKVNFSKKAAKQARKLSPKLTLLLEALVRDLRAGGPVRGDWPNYSKLADGSHHCHLDYANVACWRIEDNEIKIIEVYYAGSRKDAPY